MKRAWQQCRGRFFARSVTVAMFRGTLGSSDVAEVLIVGGRWNARRSGGFSSCQFHSGRTHMLAKYITAGMLGSALLATVAFAQTPTATTDRANMAPATASDSSL